MKRSILVGVSFLLALCAGCASESPSFSAEIPLVSRYVFRGAVFDDHPVIQPSIAVEQALDRGALSASLWTNFELNDDRGLDDEFTEADLTLDYSLSIERFDVSIGAARYRYPHTGDTGSTELYVMASLNDLEVTPTLELWYDVDEVEGAYVNFNLSREFELSAEWTLSTVAGVGWMDSAQADSYFGTPSSGLSDLQAQAVISHPLSENVSISGITAWSSVIDSDLRDAVDDPDNLIVAIGLSLAF